MNRLHSVENGGLGGSIPPEPDYSGGSWAAPDKSHGLFGTRGRTLALLGWAMALVLALLFGTALVLLGAQTRVVGGNGNGSSNGGQSNSDPSAIAIANSYPITSTGADITGLGTGPKVGDLAPDFVFTDLYTGQPARLSTFKGKPVWINFWASWCPPCKAELPQMKEEYAKYKSQGLILLGVDMREDPSVVKQFASSNGYDWTFTIDSDGQITNRYYVFSIPTHVFVGREGVIKVMQIGGMSTTLMEDNLAKIIDR